MEDHPKASQRVKAFGQPDAFLLLKLSAAALSGANAANEGNR
jgi:hypothetical protein